MVFSPKVNGSSKYFKILRFISLSIGGARSVGDKRDGAVGPVTLGVALAPGPAHPGMLSEDEQDLWWSWTSLV